MSKAGNFYRGLLGLAPIEGQGDLILGAGGEPLFRLLESPEALYYPDRPGLYHTAVLLPSRFALARTLYQLAERGYQLQGAADHGVSEALYLADPEGNGIELYRDRPQSEWPHDDRGQIEMITDHLNLDQLIFELKGRLEPWSGIDPQTRIGHVHLQVSDLAKAEQFYTQVISLELQQRYGAQAAFLSAGGYHHHVGINTWQSHGAPARPVSAAGLRYFELLIPNGDALAALLTRARQAGIPTEGFGEGWLLRDPSGNGVVVRGPVGTK
jgi:catechol 2,3-dioxygenase